MDTPKRKAVYAIVEVAGVNAWRDNTFATTGGAACIR